MNRKNSSVKFIKMQGCGNDFILIDFRENNFNLNENQIKLFGKLCDRNFGIGANDILLISDSSVADARLRIIEPDGSEADMCGNGIRCVARYLMERVLHTNIVEIETRAGIKRVERVGNLFRVSLGNVSIENCGRFYRINSGEPHLVKFVDNLDFDIVVRARELRGNENTNVNFARIVDRNIIQVRNYERGVEDETLACGTGATAAAAAAVMRGLQSPINVLTRGGALIVELERNENYFSANLIGPSEFVFDGTISPNFIRTDIEIAV